MIQKDLQGNLWKCGIVTRSSGKTFRTYQQEIERLNENNQHMQEEMARTWEKYDNLQARIDKAIEYIDELIPSKDINYPLDYYLEIEIGELLGLIYILKGNDEE